MTTAVEAISTPLLIAGEERPGSAGTFPVYDPARTGAIIGYAAAASAEDAEGAGDARVRRRGADRDPVPRERQDPVRGHDRHHGLRRPVPPGGRVRAVA